MVKAINMQAQRCPKCNAGEHDACTAKSEPILACGCLCNKELLDPLANYQHFPEWPEVEQAMNMKIYGWLWIHFKWKYALIKYMEKMRK